MPQFSVIIPVYNVKKYIPQCVESVLNQSFSDYEIILIDDGSTDGSQEVCDYYAKQDARIKVIHQKNQGLGGARNSGMKCAAGKWLLFLDSDDFWEKEALAQISNRMLQYAGVKVYVCRWRKCYYKDTTFVDGHEIVGPPKSEILEFSSLEEEIGYYEKNCDWAIWKLIVKREVIQGNQLYFLKDVRRGEDLYWIMKLFSHVRTVGFLDVLFYNYCIQEIGTLSEASAENAFRWLESIYLTVQQFLLEPLEENNFVLSYLAGRYADNLILAAEKEHKREWMNKIEQHVFVMNFLNFKKASLKRKICFFLSKFPKLLFGYGCSVLNILIRWIKKCK